MSDENTAEKAWDEWRIPREFGPYPNITKEAFMAGRASRDAEIAALWSEVKEQLDARAEQTGLIESLREQLAEAQRHADAGWAESREQATRAASWERDADGWHTKYDEAQATIEKARKRYDDSRQQRYRGFEVASDMRSILSAPSSTGGNFRDDLKSRTPRSRVDFDTATQRPLGGYAHDWDALGNCVKCGRAHVGWESRKAERTCPVPDWFTGRGGQS